MHEAATEARFGVPAVLVAIPPCRLSDTRNAVGPFSGPAFAAGETRTYAVPAGGCGIPSTAVAYSFHIAVVPFGPLSYLQAWATGTPQPTIATLNDNSGVVFATDTIVAAGTDGAIDVYVTDATHVILNMNGYYALPGSLPLGGTAEAPALTFGETTTGIYSTGAGSVSISTNGANALTVGPAGNLDLSGSITKGGALFVHNLGLANAAVGLNALANQTTGASNTATGFQALQSNTTGNLNTATGAGALGANTTAWSNTATGAGSLVSNTIGDGNTAVGASSLSTNTTGGENTAVGHTALYSNSTGSWNTAVGGSAMFYSTGNFNSATGFGALRWNTAGSRNTATGYNALTANTTGDSNTAMGTQALGLGTTGCCNTGMGESALGNNTIGYANIAAGFEALYQLTTGYNNTALGSFSGFNLTNGNYNVHIANQGTALDTNLIRIGDTNQTKTFISGIRGVTTGNADSIPVMIDSNGQLGTTSSSRRVKTGIRDMRDTTGTIMSLHPVEFRYTAHGPDGPVQFGLIAEEVAAVAPELTTRKPDGEIETVYYDKVNAMLLNEVQKQHRVIESQQELVRSQQETIRNLEERLTNLEHRTN